MNYDQWAVPGLKDILKERGVRGYSRKIRDELLEILQAREPAPPPPPTWEPMAWQPAAAMRSEPPPRHKPPYPNRSKSKKRGLVPKKHIRKNPNDSKA